MIQTHKYYFFKININCSQRKLKSPNTVSEVKHYETELFFKISLFIQFIPS